MRCKVGDLAIAIHTYYRCNLGVIVRVLATHDGKGDLFYPTSAGQVWLVEATRPIKWTGNGKRYRRKVGPLPDSQLQPIRGEPCDVEVTKSVKELLRKLNHSDEIVGTGQPA